jgi:hypothetical protein
MIIRQLCYGMASDTRRESGGQGGGCFDAIFGGVWLEGLKISL